MSLELTVVVLLAALMHAVWNALVKSSSDHLIELAALNLSAGLIALGLLPVVGLPGRASLPYLLGTMCFHSGYYTFLLLSYSAGGLSLVYPIARGASPFLVAAVSGALLGESLGPLQVAGVVLIALSITSLALAGGWRQLSVRAVLFSVATGVMIAGYTLTDGVGARLARTPISYIATLFALNTFPLLVVLPLMRRGVARRRMCAQWKTGFLGGVLSIAAYGLVIWAMTRGAIALVAALRETSVVLAAVVGTTLLGEPFGRNRILASTGVALGIIILRLGS
jgi:drug/metabolite transporter (DMT)-like permease